MPFGNIRLVLNLLVKFHLPFSLMKGTIDGSHQISALKLEYSRTFRDAKVRPQNVLCAFDLPRSRLECQRSARRKVRVAAEEVRTCSRAFACRGRSQMQKCSVGTFEIIID